MNKKLIIITAAAGLVSLLVSFGGAFVFLRLTAPSPVQSEVDGLNEPSPAARQTEPQLSAAELPSAAGVTGGRAKETMGERQLKDLVYDVQEKIQEYDSKLQSLDVREQRLKTTHDMLKEDLEDLGNLRIELASIVSAIKEEQAKLKARLIEINKVEKNNLMTISATYDKMDVASAGKILTDMTRMSYSGGSDGFEDAVKILYYMSERAKGKVLAELATSESMLAAVFCRRLKQVVEKE